MKYKVGIIGSEGKIGRLRSEIIKIHPNLELVARADPKISENNHNAYKDWRNMLKAHDLDIVFICTPHVFIPEITIECLENGLHVFAEKPPGINLQDTLKIKEVKDKNKDLKLQFGFNHRWHDSIEHILSIGEMRFGKLLWMNGEYGKGELEKWRSNPSLAGHGILLGQGIHMLDLFNLFAGPNWEKVKAVIGPKYYDYPEEIEDNVFAVMKNKNGITAAIHSSATLWKCTFRLMLSYEKGYAKIDGFLTTSRRFGFAEKLILASKNINFGMYGNPKEEILYFDIDNSWFKEMQYFVESIAEDEEIECGSIDDAINVMKLVDRIYENGRN